MLKKLLCFIMSVVVAFYAVGTTSVLAATRAPAKEPTKIAASWDVVGKTVKVSFERDKKVSDTPRLKGVASQVAVLVGPDHS